MISDKVRDRFWSKVDVRGEDECWLWLGCVGHGDMPTWMPPKDYNLSRYSVRAAWELTYGEIPQGKRIRKTCGVNRCCNPKHLKIQDELSDRFWSKVDKTPGNGIGDCWLWTSTLRKDGRGSFKVSAKRGNVQSHRLAYELAKGKIPDDLCVLHVCDIGRCCNPSHLFLGTQKDNVRDAINKGRFEPYHTSRQDRRGKQTGSKNNHAKLNEDSVRLIKQMLEQKIDYQTIADRFEVCKGTIEAINAGRSWTHVN